MGKGDRLRWMRCSRPQAKASRIIFRHLTGSVSDRQRLLSCAPDPPHPAGIRHPAPSDTTRPQACSTPPPSHSSAQRPIRSHNRSRDKNQLNRFKGKVLLCFIICSRSSSALTAASRSEQRVVRFISSALMYSPTIFAILVIVVLPLPLGLANTIP